MDVQGQLQKFITEELQAPADSVGPDAPLISSHVIDSLGMLSIVSFIENEFGVEIQDEDLVPDNFETITAIAKLVASKG